MATKAKERHEQRSYLRVQETISTKLKQAYMEVEVSLDEFANISSPWSPCATLLERSPEAHDRVGVASLTGRPAPRARRAVRRLAEGRPENKS